MLTQTKVNEICQLIKRDGNEISISKVRNLLDRPYSFFTLADKVLLYKENPDEAEKLAKNEITDNTSEACVPGIADTLDRFVKEIFPTQAPENQHVILAALVKRLVPYIDSTVSQKLRKISEKARKTTRVNDHLAVRFYGLQGRFNTLLEQYESLKEAHYHLQQELQNAKAARKYPVQEERGHQMVQVRDYKIQLSLLKGPCCAAYDAKGQRIVAKLPSGHKLAKEFEKGERSILLGADAVFDFASRCWFLSHFEAKTVNLLLRNKFIISKELSLVAKKLNQRTDDA